MQKLAYTIPEVTEVAGIKKTNIYEHIKAGRLIAVKMGHRTLIRHSDLQDFLESLPQKAAIAA